MLFGQEEGRSKKLIPKPTTYRFFSQISRCKYKTVLPRCETLFHLDLFAEYCLKSLKTQPPLP